MLIHGKYRIIKEAKNEFQWIKYSKMSNDEKLAELVNLRNYLYKLYLLDPLDECERFVESVREIVVEIDKYWWLLFTGKKVEARVQ